MIELLMMKIIPRSLDEVCEAFRQAGLCEVEKVADLSQSAFCRDPLCPDTLVFPQQLHMRLQHSSLVVTHELNTQVVFTL